MIYTMSGLLFVSLVLGSAAAALARVDSALQGLQISLTSYF